MPVEAAERHGFRARCPSVVSEQGHTQRGFLRTGRVNKGHEPGFKERSSLNMSEDERSRVCTRRSASSMSLPGRRTSRRSQTVDDIFEDRQIQDKGSWQDKSILTGVHSGYGLATVPIGGWQEQCRALSLRLASLEAGLGLAFDFHPAAFSTAPNILQSLGPLCFLEHQKFQVAEPKSEEAARPAPGCDVSKRHTSTVLLSASVSAFTR